MNRLLSIALVAMLLAGPAHSQSGFWRDPDGKPVQETESMKSKNDFAGSLIVTIDEDWEKKWDTPPETKPTFHTAGVIAYGKKVFVLTFFANPMRDGSGKANVRCDIKLTSPTGQVSLAQQNMTCFSGEIAGNPYNMYLSAPVIGFSGDPGDPAGIWVVEVQLRDAIRNVQLPLRTTFELR
jgi:hypothetical protein